MGEIPENIYKSEEMIMEEKERLKSIEYPAFVSREVIGDDVSGKTILDLGSGPNTSMNKFAKERGASYVAFDMAHEFLKEQKNDEAAAVEGVADALPFKSESADIVHTRFVLMHLPPEKRKEAIEEAIRTSKGKAVFIEYDWGTFQGSEKINHFRDLAIGFLKRRGIEPFMGAKLKSEIEDVFPGQEMELRENHFARERGIYYKELMPLIRSVKMAVDRAGDTELAREFSVAEQEIDDESKNENPEGFIPPDLVVVEVARAGQSIESDVKF